MKINSSSHDLRNKVQLSIYGFLVEWYPRRNTIGDISMIISGFLENVRDKFENYVKQCSLPYHPNIMST